MVGNMQGWLPIDRDGTVRRNKYVPVSMPDANIDISGGCQCRDCEVICPNAKLCHLYDIDLEPPLKFVFIMDGQIWRRSRDFFPAGLAGLDINRHEAAI